MPDEESKLNENKTEKTQEVESTEGEKDSNLKDKELEDHQNQQLDEVQEKEEIEQEKIDVDSVLAEKVQLESLGSAENNKNSIKMDLLMNLSLNISIELGRTEMLIKDILKLGIGSIVELNKLAGEPVDVLVNNKKFAEGEVVVIDENFGVRILNLVNSSTEIERISEAITSQN